MAKQKKKQGKKPQPAKAASAPVSSVPIDEPAPSNGAAIESEAAQEADAGTPSIAPSSDPIDDDIGRSTFEPRRDVAEISAYVDEVDSAPISEPTPPPVARTQASDVAQEFKEVEAALDRMWAERPRREPEARAMKGVVERIRDQIPIERPGGEDGGLLDAAKDVLSTDYYLRQWGRIGLRNRSEEVDEFGLDPVYEKRLQPVFDFLFRHYFRVELEGVERVPAEGRCVLVANHSGVLPYDGIMVRTALRREHPHARELRWLAEDFIFHLPFVGAFMNRIGAVRACQENAERLLRQERAVLVFPEGIKGIGKLYRDRYKLQRFGRGGFIKLALRTQAPIIPVSIVGAEESAPMLYRIEYLTQALGLPFVPVTPTFPLLGPLGLVPAPSKWKITFGAPIRFSDLGAEAAEDALLVTRLAERVRGEIQKSLEKDIGARKSVWFG